MNHTTLDPNDELDAGVLAAVEPLGVASGKTFDPSSVRKVHGKALAAAASRARSAVFHTHFGTRISLHERTAGLQPAPS